MMNLLGYKGSHQREMFLKILKSIWLKVKFGI